MVGKINRAKGDYRSQYGVIISDWQVDESTGTFTWNVSIPSGATSQLEIPVADEQSSVSIKRVDGEACFDLPAETTYQEVRGDNPSRRVTTVGSGNYKITSQIVR